MMVGMGVEYFLTQFAVGFSVAAALDGAGNLDAELPAEDLRKDCIAEVRLRELSR